MNGDAWTPAIDIIPERLAANLEALSQFHPALYQPVLSIIESHKLFANERISGCYEALWRNGEDESFLIGAAHLQVELPRVRRSLEVLSPVSETSLIFALGFDAGYTFQILQPHLIQADKKAVVIIEPDLRLFALGLALHPLQQALRSNRVLWAVGDDFESQLRELFDRHHLFAIARAEVFFATHSRQPSLAPVWTRVRHLTQELSQDGRRRFEREMAQAKNYYRSRTTAEIRKIMAPYYEEGKAIPYIQKRFLDQCERLGIETVYHRPAFLRGIALLREIARERPDLLLCINKSPSEMAPAGILNELRLPRMIWCIDDPNVFIKDSFTENDFVFTWDISYSQNLLDKQARQVDHFPYVADLDQVEAPVDERFASPVSYIGQVNPFDAYSLGIEDKYIPLIEQIGRVKAQHPERSYQSLLLEHQDSFGFTVIHEEQDEIPRFLRYGMYIVGNAQRRILILEKAMPFGLKLYGNEGWLKVLGDHPLRKCYQGPAHPERDVPRIFVSSTVNLNIHSLQALSSLNQRDFNCPLVGGFLLTDWVENADQFFVPDEEMVFYFGPDDLAEKIAFYLNHPEQRLAILQRGRERVLHEHTYEARVPKVLETLCRRIQERYHL